MSQKVHFDYFRAQNRDICSVAGGRTWTDSLDSRAPSWFNGLEWAKGRLRNCYEYDAFLGKRREREIGREGVRSKRYLELRSQTPCPFVREEWNPHIPNCTSRIGFSALTIVASLDPGDNNGRSKSNVKASWNLLYLNPTINDLEIFFFKQSDIRQLRNYWIFAIILCRTRDYLFITHLKFHILQPIINF